MSQMLIRPSMKIIFLQYVLAGALAAAIVGFGLAAAPIPYWPVLLVIPAWIALRAAVRHVQRSFTTITIQGDKLRYDTGVMSKTTRTVPIGKVQDVRVDRTFSQRLWGVGNLSIETAGETSRLTIREIDAPQVMAEKILELSSQYQK
jgi:uncharacterized membrane protein YdbT with pleckstrin-like domain